MKTKKVRIRQGFTIVELVIVIGVIGVLAAVLIPTFVNLTNKANKANDESLVTNLNKALAVSEAEAGNPKNNTFHDAMLDLEDNGYKADVLITKSGQDLLWNSKTNRFLLSEARNEGDNASAKDVDFWQICNAMPGAQKYSIYAGPSWTITAVPALTVGFDAGYRTNIESVSYVHEPASPTDKQTVVIRTNGVGTVLTVNAPNDTVNHYDVLDGLTVTAVDGASYHEYGTVNGKVEFAQGHFVIEEGGSAETIVVTATSASDVSIDLSNVPAEEAPVVYAESETVATELDTIVEASEEVKDASIQTVTYTKHVTTVDELSAALPENGHVILDNDLQVSTPVWIGSQGNLLDHSVILDLNGHTISTTSSFEGRPLMNCAKMTVTGNGTISSAAAGEGGWGAIRNYNELTILNGTFKGHPTAGGSAIDNQAGGKLLIEDGWFGGTGGLNNRDNGIATVNGGQFISEACSGIPGEVYCYALRSSGQLTLNNAYVRGAHGGVSIEGGRTVINNVDSESYVCKTAEGQVVDHSGHGDVAYYALYIAGEQTSVNCTINGGHFKSASKWAVHIGNSTPGDGGAMQKAFATINGGEFIAAEGKEVIRVNGTLGFAYLYGGKYSNNDVKIGSGSSYVAYHLADIAFPGANITLEDGWYVVR